MSAPAFARTGSGGIHLTKGKMDSRLALRAPGNDAMLRLLRTTLKLDPGIRRDDGGVIRRDDGGGIRRDDAFLIRQNTATFTIAACCDKPAFVPLIDVQEDR